MEIDNDDFWNELTDTDPMIKLMPVVEDFVNMSTNKSHLLMMLKKYEGSDDNSVDVRILIGTRLKQLCKGDKDES